MKNCWSNMVQGLRFLLVGVSVLALSACGGGGGNGSGGSKEEVKAPSSDWAVDNVAYLVKDGQHATELVVQGTGFSMRLECKASASGQFNGSVVDGEVSCWIIDPNSNHETERTLDIESGSWEQSVGAGADELKGLRFELSGVDEESGNPVEMRVLGMDLLIRQSPDATECSGSVEDAGTISLDRAPVQSPGATAGFQLRVL